MNDDLKNEATKTHPVAKVIFYIFGIFCAILALITLSSGISSFKYDMETTGIITEINYSFVTKEYDLKIEFTINGEEKFEYIDVEHIDSSITEGTEVTVMYKSSNPYDRYLPDLESNTEWIITFIISATISIVCFMAPTNSDTALNIFFKLGKYTKKHK